MGKIKSWSISVDEEIISSARGVLTPGEKLSPIISNLLQEWIKKRKGLKEEEEND